MQYTLKRLIDKHPELCEQLKAKCYAINGACAAVHRELGPFLNEYMYQEALQILLDEQQIPNQREYYFQVVFHGKPIQHKHFVDFLINDEVIVECKAVDKLVAEHRSNSGTTCASRASRSVFCGTSLLPWTKRNITTWIPRMA